MDKLPSRIGDFDIKLDQAEVTLTKKHNSETYVTIEPSKCRMRITRNLWSSNP